MNCHATRAVLDLHAEGRLTPRREQDVARHLASCAACRARTAAPAAAAVVRRPPSDFKARLVASMKAERGTPATLSATPPPLNLWPRDLSGVAVAAAALAVIALSIGWSGVPTQFGAEGPELASGRIP